MNKIYRLWIKFLNLFRKKKYYPGPYTISINGVDFGKTEGGVWVERGGLIKDYRAEETKYMVTTTFGTEKNEKDN